MKRAAWNIVSLLALLTLAVGATATPPQAAEKTKDAVVKGVTVATDKTKDALSKTGEVMTDEWITGRVHARFVGEDLLKDSNISVNTRKHVVTLNGTVTGRAGRTKAGNVALRTEGVRRVVNRLTIGSKRKD
jgi:hyperosmotically inducible periplasmic protein